MRLIELLIPIRRVPIVTVQLTLVAASFLAAYWLRFDGSIPDAHWQGLLWALPWVVAIRGVLFVPFGLYQGLWRYTGLYDLQWLVLGILASSLVLAAFIASPFGPVVFPRSVLIIDTLLLTMLLGGLRMSRRVYDELSLGAAAGGRRRVLIFGAGSAGQMIVREMLRHRAEGLVPVGFVDDDPGKQGLRIHGVKVLGTRAQVAAVLDEAEPTEVLIAMPHLEPTAVRAIVRELEPFRLPIKTLPHLRDIIDGHVGVSSIRNLALEDLLARAPVGLDQRPLKRLVEGRRVLVTGAGGSIGSELCRQILKLRPSRLVMLERYENSLHAIRLELDAPEVIPVVGDVTDQTLLRKTFETHKPGIVFHAAAHKHVPLMEENPCEAIKNNVFGTRILSAAAEAAGVDRFVLISTDKAANPSSIMGASKRVAELIVQARASVGRTTFKVVRFGNVLGSNGSVVPLFLDQIRRGGPVTVTHPEVRRFFMVIPEAVQLVLHAAAQPTGSNTYALDMGEQIRVVDVARNLIRLSGLTPDDDIQIAFTGLRPGEKLQEELTGSNEELAPSEVPKVLLVKGDAPSLDRLWPSVEALEDAAFGGDAVQTARLLLEIVGGRTKQDAAGATAPAAARPAATSAAAAYSHQSCPRCGAPAYRSRTRRFDLSVRKRLTAKRLFRCASCSWRGWLLPLDVATPDGTVESRLPPPDLAALDSFGPAPTSSSRR